jgi:hypothetical protein
MPADNCAIDRDADDPHACQRTGEPNETIVLMLGPAVAALRLDRALGRIAALLLASSPLPHAFDQAVWSHVGPMLVYELEASGAAVRFMNDVPALRDGDEARPKRMLSFFVDQNMVDAVFVFKWIGHVVLLGHRLWGIVRCRSIWFASTLPIFAAGGGSIFIRINTVDPDAVGMLGLLDSGIRTNRYGGGSRCQVERSAAKPRNSGQIPSTGRVRVLGFERERVRTLLNTKICEHRSNLVD